MPHPILTINVGEIQSLNDEQARELVARLVHAEAEKLGAISPAITWGGDQRAKDGGIDVRFAATELDTNSIYLPKKDVGYQVKAEKFPPSKIFGEMTSKGNLSSSIADLLGGGGAYIIASTHDNVSDTSLSARKAKMAEFVNQAGLVSSGSLDFLDARRIADWAEQFPSIVTWIKHTARGSLQGWRPYGPWAYRESDAKAVYLIDDKVKVFAPHADKGCGVLEAIDAIRRDLRAGRIVRLVGLSGVGKTRLVQALFDPRVSTSMTSLSQDEVIYADLSDHLEPQPTSMAETLVGSRVPTCLVVDNCGQELHKRLAEIVARASPNISLLTVEYDIRDDLPEGTSCYRLEGSSDAVIKKLLARRYVHLSENDIDRVAEFSDGNARVAFALASTPERSDELAQLTDDALFKRLFHQKQTESDELLRCAEAASLLYSFDCDDTSETSELALLASTVGLSVAVFYRGVAELQRRGLVQQRGKWRAVLPHAIANKLAARALESNPPSLVVDTLLDKASERIAKSCSRRLGYLHNSPNARRIVTEFLKPDGRFDRIEALDDVGRQVLKNVLPVNPSAGLSALVRTVGRTATSTLEDFAASDLVRIAKSLAYDADMFDDGLRVMMAFAEGDNARGRNSSSHEAIVSLFSCHLSGTHVSPEKRVTSLRELLRSNKPLMRKLGLDALRQALETAHFNSQFEADFGARRRDYGWSPKSREDVVRWYGGFTKLALETALQADELGREGRILLGRAVRGLCADAGMINEVEEAGRALAASGGWPDGWIGVRETMHWGKSSLPAEILGRLSAVERLLAPTDLLGEIRSIVIARGTTTFDLMDGDDDDYVGRRNKILERARRLGCLAANAPTVISQVLPDLLSDRSSETSMSFGIGLGSTLEDPAEVMSEVKGIIARMNAPDVSPLAIRGLLQGWQETNPVKVGMFLDNAVSDPIWGQWFPELQWVIGLEGEGIKRVFRALRAGIAPIWRYRYLSGGRTVDILDPETIEALARSISDQPDGGAVAVDLLGMVVHSARERGESFVQDIAERIRSFLAWADLSKCNFNDTMFDHHLNNLLSFALTNAAPSSIDNDMLDNVLSWERSESRRYAFRRGRHLQPFFKLRPKLALDAIYQPDPDGSYWTARGLASNNDNERGRRPMEAIPIDAALEWCAVSPDRFRFMAQTCSLYASKSSDDERANERLSEIAGVVFKAAPDKNPILKAYLDRLRPMSWSGSRAAQLRRRLGILDDLIARAGADETQMLNEARVGMLQIVADMELQEDAEESERNETFE
jgi:hypothetical protein